MAVLVLIFKGVGVLIGVYRASTGFVEVPEMSEVGESLDIGKGIEDPILRLRWHEGAVST